MSFLFIAELSSAAVVIICCCNIDLNGILALWWAHRETIFKLEKDINICADVYKVNTIIFYPLPVGGKEETMVNKDIRDQ